MIKFMTRIFQCGQNILFLQIRKFLEDILVTQASCQQVKDIYHPDT